MFFAKLTTILIIIYIAIMFGQVEPKATFGIGMRIIGDQLLVKDVLQARSTGLEQSATIGFNYAIPEPITYIEILSEENVLAEVNFSYQHDLVKGTVTAINATDTEIDNTKIEPQLFEVLITIYGFNETMMNLNPAYILNRDQTFEGVLETQLNDEGLGDEDEYENVTVDDEYEFLDDNNDEAMDRNHKKDDEGVELDVSDIDFEHADKTIEVGQRQIGDYLIYETVQTSSSSTEEPANHSVVFYYVDINFITYARFVIYDHYIDKPIHDDYIPPIAEYSHYSPNALKAIITDHKTTSLFVQMFLYGYRPADLPVAYTTFLHDSIGNVGGARITPNEAEGSRRYPYSTEEVDKENENKAEDNDAATVATAAINSVVCLERAVAADNGVALMSVSSFLSILTWLLPMGLWLVGGGAATARRHI